MWVSENKTKTTFCCLLLAIVNRHHRTIRFIYVIKKTVLHLTSVRIAVKGEGIQQINFDRH